MNARPHPDPIVLPKTVEPLLEVRELRRIFGETIALDTCSLSVQPGEIHALVGENGSGKSTLIKILSGILPPESGVLKWKGAPARLGSPRAAQRIGIATVFQETLVLDDMSVRDNMILGLDGVLRRASSASRESELVREQLQQLGLGWLDIEQPTRALSLANRQLVGIARSLLRPWSLLILDEATSALDIEDRDRLFDVLRRFRDGGKSILFVSHRMDEIEVLADRSTVLRSGRSVATIPAGEGLTRKLLELMSPEKAVAAAEHHRRSQAKPSTIAVSRLSVRNFALHKDRPAFDFDLHAGEIVGVCGLEGHGQAAFLECVAGLRQLIGGSVNAGGDVIRSAAKARRCGVAFLPRDRKTEGIFAPLTVMHNVTISCLDSLSRLGLLSRKRSVKLAGDVIARNKVKTAGTEVPISSLSGGNQQKALLGRLIATRPKVLVLNDPMRGVDLGAKRDLYSLLSELANEDMSILMLSTELAELCLLCDRVLVFHDHRLAAEIDHKALNEHALIEAMFGQNRPKVTPAGASA
jgi:ABC-type sugar transport system ATPase subunit